MPTIVFVVRSGNKVLLLTQDSGRVMLPQISSGMEQVNSEYLKRKLKTIIGVNISYFKPLHSDNNFVWFEAYTAHDFQSYNEWQHKWMSLNIAQKVGISDNTADYFKKYIQDQLDNGNVKLQFGLRGDKVIHISEVAEIERGLLCGCTCPGCGLPLQARLGHGKKSPHFAHNNEACNIVTAQQTALHILAKEILLQSGHIALPAYTLPGELGNSYDKCFDIDIIRQLHTDFEYKPATIYSFDQVVLESRMDDIIPDVVISKSGTKRQLIIEIAATHFVNEEKKLKIQRLKTSALEIDISHLLGQTFERSVLENLVVCNTENKEWIYNANFEKALEKLIERNKEIAKTGTLLIAKQRKEEEERQAKYIQKEKAKAAREKKVFDQLEVALIPQEFKKLVSQQRNDYAVNELRQKLWFSHSISSTLPFFLDIPVTGEIAFSCDRRIWQMAIFDQFIFNRKEISDICVAKIWKWLTKHQKDISLNWNLICKRSLKIGNKYYNSNFAIEAIRQYMLYLSKLGFIECFGRITYSSEHRVISKTVQPPNTVIAKQFQIILDNISDTFPGVDSEIERLLAAL